MIQQYLHPFFRNILVKMIFLILLDCFLKTEISINKIIIYSFQMNILTLIVKPQIFEQILKGELKEETRQITPSSQSKYVKVTPREVTIILYDAIRFKSSHADEAPQALVKVVNTELDYEPDEEGYIQLYEDNSRLVIENGAMIYTLGDIIEATGVDIM